MAIAMNEVPDDVQEDTIFVRDVPIDKMFVHDRSKPGGYARTLNDGRVARLVAEFDANAVGVILLSLREDGTYAVIDGQHRVEAAKKAGMASLDAYVYIDLTLQEEAGLYRKFGDYLKQTALDRYVAALTEEHPETLAIDKLLDEVGLHVARSGGPEVGGVLAVSAIQRVARDFGPQILRETLRFLHEAFGANSRGFSSTSIFGTAQFGMRFFAHSNFNRKRLIERLRVEGVTGVLAKAHAVQALERTNGYSAWGKALVAIHDAGLTEQRRLGAWPAQVYSERGRAAMRQTLATAALPASIAARRIKVADQARATAKCRDCRAEPGAACKNVKGESLRGVHNVRLIDARKLRRNQRNGDGAY